MYIRVNGSISKEKRVEIENALKGLGVNFDVFNSAFRTVCEEEAIFRIEDWEDENSIPLGDDLKDELIEELEDRLYYDDYVLNGETIYNITHELMRKYKADDEDEDDDDDEYEAI